MGVWMVAVIALAGLLLFLLGYLCVLKAQLRKIGRELAKTRELSYNKQLSIVLFDRDLTELTAAINRNLEYQKGLKLETEHSQQQLRQSISDIAHDLRTPITVIKGNLQRLGMEQDLPEKCREYAQICSDKTEALKSMVDDFFELSFFESESTEAVLTRLDLTNFATQFLVDYEALIRQHHLEPDIHIPEKSVFIYADEQLLLRIFGNLLNNVIKHASRTFSLKIQEREAEVSIAFSNPVEADGKPDTAQLFDRIYQGGKARTGGGPGGLGLYIVRLLAQKQGALVRAECQGDILTIEVLFQAKKEREIS